ncbi:CHRD domain-containing protein [Zhihengliuella sp.]|uniref:CHRD domain-containing protein n=1 Tax=Zhihengliuella sp. TaxID=1954483 RepID=UPI002812587F|nr:CHRD domain-containing protein [Zhihengliuella sp.]
MVGSRCGGRCLGTRPRRGRIGSGGYAAEKPGGHDGHGGGDACTFFLEHMWANEDGIPALGSFAHVNEYHTDPAYENLVLSLASGAIGNSEMPIIDIYGGPLGWIPVFNPSHVKGHNTDYVTLLTSCGGIGIPLNSKDLTTLNVPSAEEMADLSDLIVPGLPTPEMLTDPEYLWKTTDASAILERVTPETLTNTDEYVNFAGDHFDTWRLLWETALDDVSNGNPSGVLDVLQVTENINTLESLSEVVGEDALAGALGGDTLAGVIGENPLSGIAGTDDLTGVLDQAALDGLLDQTALDGVLGDGGLDGIGGEDALGGLLGGDPVSGLTGGALSGLLGGATSETPASGNTEFTALLAGPAGASGAGQCQGTLSGSTFSVTCLYAGMSSDVTGAALHSSTGSGDLELTATGGTSGGAAGSFELTQEQIAALKAGDYTVQVDTANSADGEISGTVKPC